MRQGPEYEQYIEYDARDRMKLHPPIELEDDLSKFKYVCWKDNGDGTYTIHPHSLVGEP